jgi:hypothetical protein
MGMVGCYSLHLYCEVCKHPNDTRGEYTGNNYSACVRAARRDGWMIDHRRGRTGENSMGSGRCLCPEHRANKGIHP